MKTIRSRDNPLLKHLVRLSGSSRERRLSGTTLLDGDHLIKAYVTADLGNLELIAASESGIMRGDIAELMESAPARERAILDDKLFAQISQVTTPSGVLAAIRTPPAAAIPERIMDAVFMEGIQDPGNLGSILRSALAAGIPEVYLSKASVFAWSPKVIRAAMGAHFFLLIHENVELDVVFSRAAGQIIATRAQASESIFSADLRGPAIWLFGNEGAGLSEDAQRAASLQLAIPMAGQTESLNIAASAAICLFEQARQRQSR